jgi:toxin ParE1/3/4|tara:strand:+ start:185 stop:475 length:291 start_codon:yes stop_codon:yes gene_type:complete
MASYKLSNAADKDFEQLFEYYMDNFGLSKAKSYVDGLIMKFQTIAENPLHYQAEDYIRFGYQRSVYGKHVIYCMVSNDCVDIMRILRSKNLATAFE